MDTSLKPKSHQLFLMKKEALDSAVLETFLESAPQLILQLTIVLQTRNICKYA